MPFRNFQQFMLYSFQHFCGVHQSYALSQLFVSHEEKSEKGLFHPNLLLRSHSTLCSLQMEEEVKFSLLSPTVKANLMSR